MWDKWSSRMPGLFKLEYKANRMIDLCSKCYYVEKPEGDVKLSTKGMTKTQNEVSWQRFTDMLYGLSGECGRNCFILHALGQDHEGHL